MEEIFKFGDLTFPIGESVKFTTKTRDELVATGWKLEADIYRKPGQWYYMNESKIMVTPEIGTIIKDDRGRIVIRYNESHYSPEMLSMVLPTEYKKVVCEFAPEDGDSEAINTIKLLSNGTMLTYRISGLGTYLSKEEADKLFNAMLEHRRLPRL